MTTERLSRSPFRTADEQRRWSWRIAAAVLTVAAIPRLLGIFDNFWMDEIWSLNLATTAHSALDLVTRVHIDNNHILNTLYLFLLGDQQPWPLYRLLSLATGLGSVALAGYIVRDRPYVQVLAMMLLVAGCYLLINYSSMARGYAPAVFFSLLAFEIQKRLSSRVSVRLAFLFLLTVILGLLSHLTFVYVYGGLLAWSMYEALRDRTHLRAAVLQFVSYHGAPILFLALLYVVNARYLVPGGWLAYDALTVVQRTVALAVGGPETGPVAAALTAAALGLFLLETYLTWRERPGLAVFLLSVVIVLPLLITIIWQPENLFPRYFLLCLPFFFLALSSLLARAWRAGVPARLAAGCLLALFLVGNASRAWAAHGAGPGPYLQAVQFLSERTSGPVVGVTSDHDFRNFMLLSFYARFLPARQHIEYFPQDQLPAKGPEWFILHSRDPEYHAPSEFRDSRDIRYRLAKTFRYAGLQGWHWFVYRLAGTGGIGPR